MTILLPVVLVIRLLWTPFPEIELMRFESGRDCLVIASQIEELITEPHNFVISCETQI